MPLSLPPERPAAVLGLHQLFPCVVGDGRSVPWHVSLSHQHPQELSPPFAARRPKRWRPKKCGSPPWEILGVFASLPRRWQRGKVVTARVSPRIGGGWRLQHSGDPWATGWGQGRCGGNTRADPGLEKFGHHSDGCSHDFPRGLANIQPALCIVFTNLFGVFFFKLSANKVPPSLNNDDAG